jgi:16S rRNA (guanine1207-N2)-methyltransferase
MAGAQPLKALANVVEQLYQQSDVFGQLAPGIDNSANGKKLAFLNAHWVPATFLDQLVGEMVCEQSFRPQYLELKRAGYKVLPEFDYEIDAEIGFGACLVVIGKFRATNEIMLQKAQALTAKGGMIIICGKKAAGIKSLRTRIAKTDEIIGNYSKYHSQVFWFHNRFEALKFGKDFPGADASAFDVSEGETIYKSGPGLFSAGAIDPGSRLLAGRFGDEITGEIADLGAGWGYLSVQLADRSHNIIAIDLYEADWQAIKVCKKNLASLGNSIEVSTHWHDVALEPIHKIYDWVIMNPPFHQGRETSLELGQAFIRTAASILKPNGRLLMVANRQLAYERTISACFSSFKTLEEADGFKVILAVSKT